MDNLAWGLQMTVLGMGLVFALLALLWGLLTLVLRLDKPPAAAEAAPLPNIEPASPEALQAPAAAAPASVHGMDAELVAAILVATLTHRAIRRREAAPAMRAYWPGSLLYASRWVGAGRSRQNHSWQRRDK
jgi:sodium pump decarboxylase gamma subunit